MERDGAAEAMRVLSVRSNRARVGVMLIGVVLAGAVAVLLAWATYWLQAYGIEHNKVYPQPIAVAFVLPLAAAGWAIPRVASGYVMARSDAWTRELAAQYGASEDEVRELTRVFTKT